MTERKSRFTGLELEPGTGRRSDGNSGAVVRDADYYIREGWSHELGGRHEKALNQYSAALGEDPLCIEAWTRQLWMLLYMEELAEAIVWADKALQSFPNDPDILALKSLAQWRKGLTEAARQLNDSALAATRNSANVWLARGEMQMVADMRSASACFRHALAQPGPDGMISLRIADLLRRQRKYADALEHSRNATRALPESAWAWYGFGETQRRLGNEESALSAFERAGTLAPRDGRYRMAKLKKPGLWRRFQKWLAGRT